MSELSQTTGSTDGNGNPSQRLRGVSLAKRTSKLIQNLPSYQRSKHRVPDEITDRTQGFVGSLAANQIRSDLDAVFRSLRQAFRFKRTDLESYDTDEGAGSISTPFFRYTSHVYQNPENASEVIWQRDIAEVTAPDQLLTDSFAEVFGELFDTVELLPETPIDLEKLVDAVEANDDERVTIEYDRQLTYCEIHLKGTLATLYVTSDVFRIVHPQPTTTRILVSSFFELQEALVDFSSLS